MIEPAFSNDVRRAILDVARGVQPPGALHDPVALHQAALRWDWDCAEPAALLEFARHPDLARGTLLLLYWRSAPGYYCQYASAAEVPDGEREGYETCRGLAAIFLERTDLKEDIASDPRDDDGSDHTTAYADQPQRSSIPPRLLMAVPGERCAETAGLDLLSRAPEAAERATIAAGVRRGRALLPGLPAGAPPRDVVAAIAGAMRQGPRSSSDDLAWLWLDQLGWPWRCVDSATDGVLFGVVQDGLTLYVPDIVRRTVEADVDPAETVAFFDLLRRQKAGVFDHGFWDKAAAAFARGWLVSGV